MISDSLGRGALTTSYAYASPTVHSRGKFLVGYGQVTASTSVGTHSVTFLNSDFFRWVPSGGIRIPRRPLLGRVVIDTETRYYYLCLACFLLAAFAVRAIRRSRTWRRP